MVCTYKVICTLRIKAGGKITDVTIDKQMMSDVRRASRRRVEYLDAKRQQKSEAQQEAERKERKAVTIKELESRERKVDEEASKYFRIFFCQNKKKKLSIRFRRF